MSDQRRGGIIQVQRDGEIQDAKGNFSYNLGQPKRETIIGSDGVHGFSEKPQVAFIEGEITDRQTLDLKSLVLGENETITLRLNNGKVISLGQAWFAGEGSGNSEEGNIQVRWESRQEGQEIGS